MTGLAPKNITTMGRESFTVEVINDNQGKKLMTLKNIKGISCQISKHSQFNQSKGIIYIMEYDIDDIEEFRLGLKENYNIVDVTKATFIKTRNEQTTAFLVTFGQDTLPESIYVPGE